MLTPLFDLHQLKVDWGSTFTLLRATSVTSVAFSLRWDRPLHVAVQVE